QREQADGHAIRRWLDRLAGAPPSSDLPGDRGRPAVRSFRGGLHRFRWDDALRRDLADVARRHDVTLYMVLLAAFTTLLHRYTGQSDLVVGTPVANRAHRDLEPVVGFFVNTLPLRVDLAGDPAFDVLLGRVREVAHAAYEHQDVPLERIVAELRPERVPGLPSVVQVVFQVTEGTMRPLRLAGHSLTPELVDTGTAKFDLSVTLEETADGLAGLVEYDGDLFDAATIARLTGHFEVLARAVARSDAAPVSRLPVMGVDERDRVLRAWNPGPTPFPATRCVHELVEEHADSDATAVELGDHRLSYRGLEAGANRLAHHLRDLGVGPGTRVGVCVGRSPDLAVALLGILKAGGAYVPLDPDYPTARLARMIADAGVDVLVAHGRTAGRVTGPREVLLDSPEVAARPAVRPGNVAVAGDPAYVIYTSGSTGTPKGVVVDHRAITRLVRDTDYVRLGPDDRVAQASNSSFDAFTFELWGALANGGRAVVLPKEVVLDPDALAGAIRAGGITTMFLTTAAVNAIARVRPDAFAGLGTLLMGGEALEARFVRDVLAHGRPTRLVHVYGPTETTTFATWFEITDLPPDATTAPIGGPIANTEAHVLDAHLEPVPIGVPGELHLGGPGLAAGYLGRPAATAAKFVPDPFATEPGARLYRTGDLVRRRADGAIEFLGRVDAQVKIRGFRVEPGEVEAALRAHDAVVDAVVVLDTRDDGEKRLVAFVVTSAAVDLGVELRRVLPEYMVPSRFVVLDTLPVTPNGKVDRRALRVPDDAVPTAPAASGSPLEEVVATVWADVLSVPRVGLDDDFFALGGHSLLAVRLIGRLNEVLDADLPLGVLLSRPNPRAVAEHLASNGNPELSDPAGRIKAGVPWRGPLRSAEGQAQGSAEGQTPGSTAGQAPRGAEEPTLPSTTRPSPRGTTGPIPPSAEGLTPQDTTGPTPPGTTGPTPRDTTDPIQPGTTGPSPRSTPGSTRRGTADPIPHSAAGQTPRGATGPSPRSAAESGESRPSPEESIPLSFAQQRLWFFEQLEPGTSLYNVPVVLPLRGELDRGALSRALDGLVRRHEALRTTFPATRGRPRQEVASPAPVPLPVTDLADRPGELESVVEQEAVRPFDLAAGPLLRARLIRLSDAEHHLVLVLHHAVVDGRSLDVLFRELGALYNGQALPDVPVQNADYALWQREWLHGGVLDELLAYWRATLGTDPPVLDLPTDRPRPRVRRFRGAVVTREVPAALVGTLRVLSRREGVTPYMTLLAGFQALLGARAGAGEVTVGTPVGGRTRSGLADVVGCLINMVPLRTDVSGAPDFPELVARVRRVTLGAFAHQDLPFDKLVEAVLSRRGTDFMPLFRVMFSVLDPTDPPALDGLDAARPRLISPADSAKFDLSLVVEESADGLLLTLQYDTDLFEPATAGALLDDYVRTLRRIAARPDSPVGGEDR
ncbi:MAG: amino acid adenylation domain-containing protein, partial [Saccharothrix sp.]|nr:amino acid adenylation domain-containing protein [Saccharothrix sp.]